MQSPIKYTPQALLTFPPPVHHQSVQGPGPCSPAYLEVKTPVLLMLGQGWRVPFKQGMGITVPSRPGTCLFGECDAAKTALQLVGR